jgi:hypothetical protein
VAVAYDRAKQRDLGRLEGIYTTATDASTPPAGGGIYQRLLDTVLGVTGFLVRAGDILRAYGMSLAASDDLHNVKLLVPTPTGPFEFWTGNRTAAARATAFVRKGLPCGNRRPS